MLSKTFNVRKTIKFPSISSSMTLLQVVESSQNGMVVKKSEYKKFSISDSLRPFKASDFSITSLASVGALPKLRTTYMAHPCSLSLADSFTTITNTLRNVQE